MSNEKKFEPAFPMDFEQRNDFQFGMSKRFYAACAVINGLLANENTANQLKAVCPNGTVAEANTIVVTTAYLIADELLKQENE